MEEVRGWLPLRARGGVEEAPGAPGTDADKSGQEKPAVCKLPVMTCLNVCLLSTESIRGAVGGFKFSCLETICGFESEAVFKHVVA